MSFDIVLQGFPEEGFPLEFLKSGGIRGIGRIFYGLHGILKPAGKIRIFVHPLIDPFRTVNLVLVVYISESCGQVINQKRSFGFRDAGAVKIIPEVAEIFV